MKQQNMKPFILIICLLASISAGAQKAVFKWGDELCDYESIYNTQKVTKEQLQNSNDMARENRFDITTSPMIFKPADIDTRMRLDELEQEFTEKSKALAQLHVPQTPYWQGYKAALLREQQQRYRFNRIHFMAYKDVNALKQYTGKSKAAQQYADALIAGGDQLLAAWQQLRKEMAARNGDPARIQQEYEQHLASPDRLRYALVDVLTFGWGNSANNDIETVPDAYTQAVDKEWRKLFLSTKKLECDEP